MTFERPSLKELIARIDAGISSRLKVPQVRRSNAKVYGRVLAGASHELHGFIEYASRQIFVDTADSEHLDRHAAIFGMSRKAATKASGTIKFSWADSATPVDVPIGSVLSESTSQQQYQTTSSPSSDGTTAVTALVAGSAGNLEAGDVLTLISPVEGVMSEAVVAGLSGGADAEDDEALRARVLARQQEPPHGGSKSDYVQWALEVAGVTRAWCYPLEDGDGTVTIRFVCDDLDPISPSEEMVKKVQDYIDEVRPVTADVTVTGPSLKPVDIEISTLTPDTSAVRAAVQAELGSLFKEESQPGGIVYLSHIRAAISAASGEVDHELISPSANVSAGKNELLTLGEITWS